LTGKPDMKKGRKGRKEAEIRPEGEPLVHAFFGKREKEKNPDQGLRGHGQKKGVHLNFEGRHTWKVGQKKRKKMREKGKKVTAEKKNTPRRKKKQTRVMKKRRGKRPKQLQVDPSLTPNRGKGGLQESNSIKTPK